MTKKIFRSIIAVAMIVLLASLLIATSFLYDYFNTQQINQLKEELHIVSANSENINAEDFEKLKSSVFRFTLIASDGTVLCDTDTSAENMENHLEREEVKKAIENGKGSSIRYSSTLTERTVYEAILLENGNVLRISINQITVGALVLEMLPAICIIIIIAVLITFVLSSRMSKSIMKPLDELDLEHPAENDSYEELSPILTKINKQHKQITKQKLQLRRKNDEFKQIADSMNEGLVLLDKDGIVLSINSAAKKLFGLDENPVGSDFLTVDRSSEMNASVQKAFSGKRSEFREERNGCEYEFIINRIQSEGKMIGVVIICLDVTETAFAEKNRQEFTANVSHELKTPLQSIIGSAELLENGLVKDEDTKRFIGNIKNEAVRLVSLINDIIRLSQLDENNASVTETVDLYQVANEVVEVLTPLAEKKMVEMHINGENCLMNGVRRYLYEIVYNLCDNAIRYNVEGGKVIIDIKNLESNIVLTVSDTGIGIPAEHQSRIFERFYRVDKSHSKETGGTGLGLSIVKHAVAYHGGTINLESVLNKGTRISIIF